MTTRTGDIATPSKQIAGKIPVDIRIGAKAEWIDGWRIELVIAEAKRKRISHANEKKKGQKT
jgi:hypothetical protein